MNADHESVEIDAVVAWVDGSDPIHATKRDNVLVQNGSMDTSTIPAGMDRTRFENNDEIEFCLRSIRKFAPWVRTIHLVTDQQCPKFLTDEECVRLGVTLVDHQEIFGGYEDVLPTFNSLSIETVLHRIPSLAENYIYLNDDFVLLAPTTKEDFFVRDDVVLRGTWKKLEDYGKARLAVSKLLNRALKRVLGINRAMSVLQQMRGAQLAGAVDRYFKAEHVPYPMRRQTIEAFFCANQDALFKNIRHRFRNLNQFAVTALANQIEISRRHARLCRPGDSLMICFNRDNRFQIRKKIEELKSGKIRFICIQSLEEATPEARNTLLAIVKELTK